MNNMNTIEWLKEGHVIFINAYHWDAEGLRHDASQVNKLVKSSDLPLVHTIWDFRELKSYPKNLNDIREAIRTLFTNQQLGWVLTITNDPIVSFLAQAGSSIYRIRYHSFKSKEDALVFLRQKDPTFS